MYTIWLKWEWLDEYDTIDEALAEFKDGYPGCEVFGLLDGGEYGEVIAVKGVSENEAKNALGQTAVRAFKDDKPIAFTIPDGYDVMIWDSRYAWLDWNDGSFSAYWERAADETLEAFIDRIKEDYDENEGYQEAD